jgi:transcriptional regulator GlxA family with amidase domain
MSIAIDVVALPQTSGTAIMGVVDIFNIANRISERINELDEPLFKLRVLSADGKPVTCSNGHTLSVNGGLRDIKPENILFVAAFVMATREELAVSIKTWQPILPWFKQHGSKQALIATTCSGSFLLAEAGLLEGKQATTAWWLTTFFAERYPNVNLDPDAMCTQSGNIICGAGTTAYQDVCLALLEKFAGKHFARLTAKYMMIDNQRRSQAPYNILSLTEGNDKIVNKAENWIRANLARDFRIDEVAAEVAVSPRTLIRRFQNSLNETPQSFTQKLRIEKCKILLETTQMRFGEIVQRCGYNDESAFRRLFKRYCQLSPRDYRRRFNARTSIE